MVGAITSRKEIYYIATFANGTILLYRAGIADSTRGPGTRTSLYVIYASCNVLRSSASFTSKTKIHLFCFKARFFHVIIFYNIDWILDANFWVRKNLTSHQSMSYRSRPNSMLSGGGVPELSFLPALYRG